MRAILVASVIAAGSVIVVASCGGRTAAAPMPFRSSPTQQASPIPPVKNPRDVSALASRPCELLTAQQAAGFGFDLPPKQYEAAIGNLGCEWANTTGERETLRHVLVSAFTNNPTLEVVHPREHGRPFFELTEIGGYPAIVTRSNPDLPQCHIDLKPADRQSVWVSYDSKLFRDDPRQACVVGEQVAAAVLMNLPPKG